MEHGTIGGQPVGAAGAAPARLSTGGQALRSRLIRWSRKMHVSHKHRFIYIGIPRTGSKSMYRWLSENYESENLGGHHDFIVSDEFRDYLVFTVVRNPYDRWASGGFAVLWHGEQPHASKRVPSPPITPSTKPLDERSRESTAQGTTPGNGMNQSQFIKRSGARLALYFERLPECLGALPFVDRDRIPPFPHALERGRRPPGTFFDHFAPDDEKCVWAYASEDFQMLGYKRLDPGPPEGSNRALHLTPCSAQRN